MYTSTLSTKVVETTVEVNPVYSLKDTIELASGNNYTFHDGTVHSNITANESHISTLTCTYGCDSIIQTYVIAKETLTAQVCAGENYTFPDGTIHTNITKKEVYTSTLPTKVVETTVEVNPVYSLKDTVEVVNGENHTFHDGTVHSNITTNESYTSKFTSTYGCDSIIQTYIEVVPFAKERITVQVCAGENYTFPDGATHTNITKKEVYTSTLLTKVVETTVEVNPVYSLKDTVEIVSGENHTFHDGTEHSNITANESHTSKFTSIYGCDSIIQTYIEVTTNRMSLALKTGDASLVTTQEIVEEYQKVVNQNQNYCESILDTIFPSGIVERDMSYNLDKTTLSNKNWRSRLVPITENKSGLIPVYTNTPDNGIDVVFTYYGTNNESRYIVTGIDFFNETAGYEIYEDTETTLNIIALLMQKERANILTENLIIAGERGSYISDWATHNGITHNWVFTSDLSVLDSGDYDLYFGYGPTKEDVDKIFSKKKPIIVFFNRGWVNLEALSKFGIESAKSPNSNIVGNFHTITTQCNTEETEMPQFFTDLENENFNFNFDFSQCSKTNCFLNTTDSEGNTFGDRYIANTNYIRELIQYFDNNGINIFETEGNTGIKLAVLLGDKHRENIRYPVNAEYDQGTFLKILYADNSVHYARSNNNAQTDMGDWIGGIRDRDYTDGNDGIDRVQLINNLPRTDVTLTLDPTAFSEWTATCLYAPSGSTIQITRTDATTNVVRIKFNILRSGTSKIWDEYNRPQYMEGHYIEIKPGETLDISTPYGGPIYAYAQGVAGGTAQPYTLELKGVLEHACLTDFDQTSIDEFLWKINNEPFGWNDIKTPNSEIHSLNTKFLEGAEKSQYKDDIGLLLTDLNKYLILSNYNYAGLTGGNLFTESETQTHQPIVYDFCTDNNLDCWNNLLHKSRKKQHINADIHANCGSQCSGNPYDTFKYPLPLEWGGNHEMGHNLQNFKMYGGVSTEVSNNIFPFHALYLAAKDDNLSHFTYSRGKGTSFETAFNKLVSYLSFSPGKNHPMWSDTQTKTDPNLDDSNIADRFVFYNQLIYVSQNWEIYPLLYKIERLMHTYKKNETDWEANKSSLGFSEFTKDEINALSEEDYLVIQMSHITNKNWASFFEMWGIAVSDKAKQQITANGHTEEVGAVFYWVDHYEADGVTKNNKLEVDFYNGRLINVVPGAIWANPNP